MIQEETKIDHARISTLIYWWKKDGFLYRKEANELIEKLVEIYENID